MHNSFKILLLFFFSINLTTASGQSHICDGAFFFSIGANETDLFRFNTSTLNFDLIAEESPACNGLGFNPADNYIYAFYGGDKLLRIDANWQFTPIGQIPGLEVGGLWAADFSPQGEYTISGNSAKVYRIDVSGLVPTILGVADKYYINGTGTGNPNMGDIAFDPISGQCYFFDGHTHRLATLDPYTGAVNAFGVEYKDFVVVGALSFDVRGGLYGFVHDKIYQINKQTGAFNYLLNGPPNEGGIDACSCPYYMDLFKMVSKENACAGDTLVYTFYMINSSQNAIHGPSFMDNLPAPLSFVNNPSDLFGGSLSSNSGMGHAHVEITNMTIPIGTSSFQISAKVPAGLDQQMYLNNQAVMHGFPTGLSMEIVSDNATTPYLNDPTEVLISPPIDYEMQILNPSPFCIGDTLTIHAFAPESGTYQWNGPLSYSYEEADVILPNIQIEQEGRYFLKYTNYLGCSLDTFTDVFVNPLPQPNLGTDTALCLTISNILHPGEYELYLWQDGSTDSHYKLEEYGIHWVEVANEFGCISRDTISISTGCTAHVYVPNAFSPNQDGINDIFYAYSLEVVHFQMQVFDRWGEMVFKSDNIDLGWDGMFQEKPMTVGVYVYLIDITFLNGQSVRESGDFVLIK